MTVHRRWDNEGPRPLFEMGSISITSNCANTLDNETPPGPEQVAAFLFRHVTGDWGDLDDQDRETNQLALANGARILSCFHSAGGEKVYVITEWDRSSTTVLLAEDY